MMIFDTSILILVPKLYRKGHTELVILFFKRTHAVRFYQKTIIFTMTSQSSCHYIHSTRGSPPRSTPTFPEKSLYIEKKIPVLSFLTPYTKFCTFVIGVLMPATDFVFEYPLSGLIKKSPLVNLSGKIFKKN